MNQGETNLQTVLDSLAVSCDNVEYGFAKNESGDYTIPPGQVLGTFRESEALTIFAEVEVLKEHGLEYMGPLAKITIEVHTALELVGLTAVLATKLGDSGISANVVAAYYHDHIFVPYEDRERAIRALLSLKTDN